VNEEMTDQQRDTTSIPTPEPSIWPIVLAAGVVMMAAGVLSTLIVTAVGLVILLTAIVGWTQENRVRSQQEDSDHV
jgi:hypothetical protein